jgi:hypothetical protein
MDAGEEPLILLIRSSSIFEIRANSAPIDFGLFRMLTSPLIELIVIPGTPGKDARRGYSFDSVKTE